jgi:hypothetical protein
MRLFIIILVFSAFIILFSPNSADKHFSLDPALNDI